MCLSSWGLSLPIAPYHSAFLGAGGENAQEAAASSELPESKVSDTDHANLRALTVPPNHIPSFLFLSFGFC